MLRRIISFVIAAALLFVLEVLPEDANAAESDAAAQALYSLGLFRGTGSGFELSRAPSRVEALVMLIRLLGAEDAALADTRPHPFTDVPEWASRYVGYAFNNGLTNGVSDRMFDASGLANANMYITFVLRALGYSDLPGGDFSFEHASEFAKPLGLTPENVSLSHFTRGDAVIVSVLSLDAQVKDGTGTLADKLITDNVFTRGEYESSIPSAQLLQIVSNDKAKIDLSQTAEGVVRAAYTGGAPAKIKTIITAPNGTKYTYDLKNDGTFETFPLSEGDGNYSAGVYVNVSGTQYTMVLMTEFSVVLRDKFAPFLRSNQYVSYRSGCAAEKLASQLTKNVSLQTDTISAIFSYVTANIAYDKDKAKNVSSGYLPDIDMVLSAGKGICFDYAAVMTAMLRSLGIPSKLVIGYAGSTYHAWISVYISEIGWVMGAIYFDGTSWTLMDPTFWASGNAEFTLNASNYIEKYYY